MMETELHRQKVHQPSLPKEGAKPGLGPSRISVLHELMNERRAIRVFDGLPVPAEVVRECLELALLTPSSSNLQPWEFYWIRSEETRERVNIAFLSQSAARTASELIVVVARTMTWDAHRQSIFEQLQSYGKAISAMQLRYYSHVCKSVYNQGWMGWRGFMKRVINVITGRGRALNRHPSSLADMKVWAVKSTALACQTLMMAFQAKGYDTCPLEGMDSKMLGTVLRLPKDAVVVMGVAVGKRSYNGVSSPRIRLDRSLFLYEV